MATVTTTSPYGDLKECLSLTNSGTTDLAYNFGNILKISDEYTFSCWIKANKNTKIKVQISNNISDYFTVTTAWTKVVYTAKADISKSKVVLFSVPAGVTLYAFEGMLEKGNMPSDFKKNEEDLENTVTTLQTDFKVEQGKITSLIKETETIKSTYTTKDEFNNLQIGGRNLLKNSSMVGEQLKCDSRQGCNSVTTLAYESEGFHIVTPSEGNVNNGIVFVYNDFTKLGINAGDTITFSLLAKGSSDSNRPFINIIFQNDGTTWYGANILVSSFGYFTPTDTFKKVYVTYTLPTDKKYTSKTMFLGIHGNMKSDLYVKNFKLELGNKATSWTPAPEDLETKVTTLTDKYNQTVQTVEGNKTTIASIKTTVDDHTKNIKSMDSRITTVETTADGLKTSVSKVQKDVDGVQIGGRNLWVNSSVLGTSTSPYSVSSNEKDKYFSVFNSKVIYTNTKFNKGDVITVQAKSNLPWASVHGGSSTNKGTVGYWLYYCETLEDAKRGHYKYAIFLEGDGKSAKFTKTLNYAVSDAPYLCFRFNTYSDGNETYEFKLWDVKLELGNRPTDWTPAPEDVDNSIQTLAEQTASKFSWIVKSGSSSSNFTLTDRTAQLVADSINLKGLVKFSGLNSDIKSKLSWNNLIVNGNFMDGTSNWVAENTSLVVADDNEQIECGRVIPQTAAGRIYQTRNWTSGQKYACSFMAKIAPTMMFLTETGCTNISDLYISDIKIDSDTSISFKCTKPASYSMVIVDITDKVISGVKYNLTYTQGSANKNASISIDEATDANFSNRTITSVSSFTAVAGRHYRVKIYANNTSTASTETYTNSYTNIKLLPSTVSTAKIRTSRSLVDFGADNTITSEWKKYTSIITSTATAIGGMLSFSFPTIGVPYLITNIKLEEGDTVTDWSANTADLKNSQSILYNWAKDSVVAGETSINGGYIKTNTIETDQLAVDKIFATGSAVMNIINAQEINANRITSGLLSANRLDVYGLNVLNKETNQQTFAVSNGGEVSMRGSVSSYDYHEGKTGWTINKDGTAEFNDIIARGSVITNDGGIVSSGGTGENLLANSSLEVNLDGWTNNSGYAITTMDGYKCAKVSGALTTTKLLTQSIYSKIKDNSTDTHYTMSCWVKLVNYKAGITNPFCALYLGGGYDNNGTSTFLDATNLNGTSNNFVPYNNKDWQYMTCTFKFAQKPTYMTFYVYARDFTGDLYVRDIKLEEGDIATSWSAAKEDKTKQVRFWAGATYDERDSAPFVVYNDGTIKATQGEFSGVFSGTVDIGNITIQDPSATAGGDAIVTIRNGQTGVNTVQLTDLGESKFAQNLIITNNTYSNMVSLKQDGTGLFQTCINVADTVILNGSGVNINNALISADSTTKAFTMSNDLNVGTSSLGANLIVHGDASAENVRVSDVLYFGSVVKFTTTSNGINIDYIGG